MIEEIIKQYTIDFDDRQEELLIKNNGLRNFYERNTYNSKGNLVNWYRLTPLDNEEVLSKFNQEKKEYTKLLKKEQKCVDIGKY